MTALRAIDVQELYSDNYFFGEKGEYPDYLAEESLLIKRGACYAKIMSRFLKRPGKMLDVGTAAGFVLKGFVDSGWDGTGIEPNERMAGYGRSHLHLKIHTGQIESFTGQEKYDVISLIQVIAHFADPVKAVRACLDLLKRKGYLLVETWDWRSLTARLLGRFWHEFNPPYVLQWFSWKSLNHLMAYLDLKLVAKDCPEKNFEPTR
jgi:2-polyprenyl-3-methyl-5-hydroxy-6-metoxy-1,4-benzoquinol methylase